MSTEYTFLDQEVYYAENCDICGYDSINCKRYDTEWGRVFVCSDMLCNKELNNQLGDYS